MRNLTPSLALFALVGLSACALAQQGGQGGAGQGGSGVRMPEPQAQPQKRTSEEGAPPETPEKPMDPLIDPDPAGSILAPWYNFKQMLKRDYRLDINTYYTAAYQYATDTFSDQNQLLNGRYDLNLNWTAFQSGKDTGSLAALMRSGENIGINQSYNLGTDVGDNLGVNSLQGNAPQQNITLNLLYWRQSLFENKLALYIGKLHPNQYIDLSMVANDEATQFLAGCFDGTSSDPLEGAYTPGVAGEWQITDTVHLNGIAVDSQGKAQTGISTLDEGHFYEAAELGYQPDIKNLGKGNYRLIGWHNEIASGQDGYGASMLLEQEVGGGWVPSVRWGYGNPQVTSIEQNVALVIGNLHPFGRRGDMWGLGVAWGHASDDSRRDETLLETFYRIKLTKSLEVSPDVELLMPSSNRSANDFIAIFGMRVRAVF